jgi:uncharacterized protein
VKIVLDTNVIVSGLLNSKGNPAAVLDLALSGAVQVCHDARILTEYSEVLARPRFRFDPQRVREVLTKLESDGLAISAPLAAFGLPDPDDEPFLDVALAAATDYLVTGNLADYPPEKCQGMQVLTPASFMAQWRTQHPGSSPSPSSI